MGVVETFLGFSFEYPPYNFLVMRVHIVWMKGIRVKLKIIQAESFAGHLGLAKS